MNLMSQSDKASECILQSPEPVTGADRTIDIELLARMAARLAGRDPDQHVRLELQDVVAFDDAMWRYPDFLSRAEAAYKALNGRLASPE